jgi:putative nucleic acid modification protein with dual OB domain
VKVLITDLTRMYDGHICAAGFDIDNGRRVRPVGRQRLPASMLANRGGVFDLGNVVEIGRTRPERIRPEIEDMLFDVRAAKVVNRLAGAEFFAYMREHAVSGLDVIGTDLSREGRSVCTPKGKGNCSLVITMATERTRIIDRLRYSEPAGGRREIRFIRSDGVDLSVTDVRLYVGDDLSTPDLEKLRWLKTRLLEPGEIVLCFGLGRAWPDKHYLQLNNLHLSNAPDWRLS